MNIICINHLNWLLRSLDYYETNFIYHGVLSWYKLCGTYGVREKLSGMYKTATSYVLNSQASLILSRYTSYTSFDPEIQPLYSKIWTLPTRLSIIYERRSKLLKMKLIKSWTNKSEINFFTLSFYFDSCESVVANAFLRVIRA